jgi:FkbM family methyltransferase
MGPNMNLSDVTRNALERATRNWVYRRRLPADFGSIPLFVTPAAGLKYLFRSLARVDPHLLRNAVELIRLNDTVWDIGAHVGLFTFAAAALAGRNGSVIAFEPDILLAQILRKSTLIQPVTSASVTVIPAAVAAHISLRGFAIASRSRASNALAGYGHSQMGSIEETQTVVALNLDWLLTSIPAPNLIKCDVEGAEIEVFAEQSEILNSVRPAIVCEVSSTSAKRMTEILIGAGYRLFEGEKALSRSSEVTLAPWSTIAIPEERLDHYVPKA